MKIICVGWNYPLHNKEMNKTLEDKAPIIFIKPDSAILKSDKPFFLPDFSQRVEFETELVFSICKVGKNISAKFAHRYYDAVTVGIDFTARDLQEKLRAAGEPWEMSKAFDNSAVLGNFINIDQFKNGIDDIDFSLSLNGEQVQKGNSSQMISSIDQIIAYVSKFITLKIGDLIYTGTPSGVGPVKIGDHLQGYISDEKLFDFHVR